MPPAPGARRDAQAAGCRSAVCHGPHARGDGVSGLTTGQRVRVRRSGKVGILITLGQRADEDGPYVAALVLLDPFVAHWADERPSCLTALEGIYRVEDLEAAAPGAIF